MKKIISFSLWGDKPMYCKGALENIALAKEYYPNWICRFYFDNSVPIKIVEEIKSLDAETIKIETKLGNNWGMFWRFMANDDLDMEVMISRDCDSRLNVREKVAVDEWLESDKGFHIMHDHYGHRSVPILGGMWGSKKGCISNMIGKIHQWGNYANKGIDQNFLSDCIWGLVKDKSLMHGARWGSKYGQCVDFPHHPPIKYGGTFVGEIFDENNNPVRS